MTVTGNVVGLYSVVTRLDFRHRGFGTALTLWPLMEAARHGHQIAVLQTAHGGVNIYRRLGFERFGEIAEYKAPDQLFDNSPYHTGRSINNKQN